MLFGRANVGKSSLFNRLARRSLTIVHDTPGTTRDLITATIDCGGYLYQLIDAAGYEPLWEDEPARRARDMLDQAIAESDLILFVLDAAVGPIALDFDLAVMLRKSPTPVLVVTNKSESAQGAAMAHEANRLGLGEPVLTSALHKHGLSQLRNAIATILTGVPQTDDPAEEDVTPPDILSIAIVGRPNAGKSSIINSIIGSERLIISETPGTTRDAVDVEFSYFGSPVLLVDTAGMRRKARVGKKGLERETVKRALRAGERAQVVCLVLDAERGVEAQDAAIADYTQKVGKPLVIVVNKWDLLTSDKNTAAYERMIKERLKFVTYARFVFISALTCQRIGKVIPTCLEARETWRRRIPTGELNRFVRDLPRYTYHGHELRILYMTQIGIEPPRFAIWVNNKDYFHFSNQRNMENRLRESFDFVGTPIQLLVRSSRTKKKARKR